MTPLGKGGMGEVYRALDTRVHREVAIKTSTERFSERFEREARAIASLNHPNVCTLYDVGPDYLVMELVDGPTLAERIVSGAIPLDESLKLASQIADALSAAHKKGVIHRDLKPGNIKVKPDGTVKVLDFGLAKITYGPPKGGHYEDDRSVRLQPDLAESPTITSPAMTMAGVVLGTAAYMSPEQAKGKPVDKNADIWAFGVVLYEMLTGKQLHQGESVSETLASVLKEAPDLSRVPARLRRLLRSCLQKNPDDRLHDIADWKLLLDDDAVETPTRVASRTRWLWPSVAALLLVVVAMLAVTQLRKAPPGAQEVRSQIPQPEGLTFNPGTQATISPDGKWLGFPAQGPDNVARMYVRSIDSLEVRPLPGSEGIPGLSPPPFWSYDSRFIAYGAQGKLRKSDVTGAPAQTIGTTGSAFVQGGAWNREGTIVYARPNSNLEQISASGGTPVAVTVLAPGEYAHRWPQFLPDGRRFLYLRVTYSSETTGVYVGSLDAKPEEQDRRMVLPTDRQAWWATSEITGKTYLLIQREGALLAQPFDHEAATIDGMPVPVATGVGSFAQATAGLWSVARTGALVYRGGGTGLPLPTWVDRTGRVIGTVGDPDKNLYAAIDLSSDGNRLAFMMIDTGGNSDIWVRDLASGATTRLTFDPRPDQAPVWSPDGKRIAYAASRGGRLDLYEKSADGSGEERLLLRSDQDKIPTSWSRDGRFILFTSADPKTRQDLWILPLEGDRKPFVFVNTEAQEGLASFSPDGRWILYGVVTPNPEVFVRPFRLDSRSAATPADPLWMISSNGGFAARWSPDGKQLYYVALNSDLMVTDVQAGVSFQSGVPRRLFNTGTGAASWSMTPKADRFLFLRPIAGAGPPPPFTMVLNWMTKLEQ
jgi:serine/threonine protein kinase/dipeptidyl aminopeptidase/acylaminoacyl peptidase